jgi:Inner centromere protein, ARK binding region
VHRDQDSGSDVTAEVVRQARALKKRPEWAQHVNILRQVAAQRGINPETIFGKPRTTCDLFELFGRAPSDPRAARKWFGRGESGDWEVDALKSVEVTSYDAHRDYK